MLAPAQVKGHGLSNEWWSAELPATPVERSFGTVGGMSGALRSGSVHVHCGGFDNYNNRLTRDCFSVEVGADPEMRMKLNAATSLPYNLDYACHGSDGERLVIAGGEEDDEFLHDEVLVLQGVNAAWHTLPDRLGAPKYKQAGVLLGDTLLCLGGWNGVSGMGTSERLACVMLCAYCSCTLLRVLVGCA